MTSFVKASLLAFIMIALISCKKGITFDPDFYVGHSEIQAIKSERGDIIFTSDTRFNDFACMHIEKIKELKKILMRQKLRNSDRVRVNKEYSQLMDRITQL